MPPKKKLAPAAKISKQDSVKETFLEPEISSSEAKKIPKKPFFRFVDYYSLTKVPHIRVKLWKIRSCSISYSVEEARSFYPSEKNKKEVLKRKTNFTNAFKSSTIKKSLKYAKRIKYDPSLFTKLRFIRQLCSTWRIDSLFVSVPEKFENYDLLRPFLKSTLKNCHLSLDVQESKIDPKLIAIFRIARKCKLRISSEMNSFNIRINPAKLLPYRKLKLQEKDDDFISEKIIINAPECFEEIRFANFDPYLRDRKLHLDLPSSLPNLKELQMALKTDESGPPPEDFSFVKQYPKIESLEMALIKYEPPNLDFLADLPDLKSLSFFSRLYNFHEYDKRPIKTLPNLTKLEKFKLALVMSNIFTLENVKDFIYQNKGLKDLDLSLTIQDIGTIFEQDKDFVLPNIEKLRLNFVHLERPYAGGAKKIAEILKSHDSIKELKLEISHSYADLIAILLKDGVAKMKSLEKLTLKFLSPGGLEENKFKHLKDVLLNNIGLETLELDLLSDVIGTRELGMILDSLMKLKNLKKFTFKARFAKMTPAAFNKLSNFIVSLRHLKVLELDFKGVSKEDEEELKQKMLPKFLLSKDSFSFFVYPMDTSNFLHENEQIYQDVFLKK